jgi:hypothetical protein
METRDSAQYRYVAGQLQRSKKPQQLRGLNANHNHDMKAIFKSAATMPAAGGTVPRFLPGLAQQRDEAGDGSSHVGAEDGGDHSHDLEERSTFRR